VRPFPESCTFRIDDHACSIAKVVYPTRPIAKMIGLPDKLTETPDLAAERGGSMDVLSDILSSLRLTGGVVIDGQLRGDFCVLSHFGPDHCAPFFPVPETIIGYHYVRSGHLIVEVDGAPTITVGPGETVIVPRNDPHRLASRPGLAPIDVSDIAWVTGDGLHHVACGNGPDTTKSGAASWAPRKAARIRCSTRSRPC
jgi:hypothetical protein